MTAIPEAAKHLFVGADIAHLATVNSDGSPQSAPVWVGLEAGLIVVNTNDGLLKTRNLRANPTVALSISGRENPYESLSVQGRVVEITAEGADESMDDFARRYLGLDRFPFPDAAESRVRVKIRAEKVNHRVVPDLSVVLQLHRDQLRHLLAKDMDAWANTFAEHAVFELPFAPAGYPQRLEGRSAIHDYVKDYATHIDLQGFPHVEVHQTADPAVIVVEAQAEGQVVATGVPYRMRYVWVITAEHGKIVHQRDYWNSVTAAEALGGDDAMRDTFNVAKP